jgi:FKBP-type peptidyl-prolyl cis-trans isomerase SlyD
VITFHYDLKDGSGRPIETSTGSHPMVFLEGAQEIMPALELHLTQMSPGDKKRVPLSAAQAYGEPDPNLVVLVPRTNLPSDVAVGQIFETADETEFPVVRVVEVGPEYVKVDGNHPLAGTDLIFEVEVLSTRAATAEEISHGHAHDPNAPAHGGGTHLH